MLRRGTAAGRANDEQSCRVITEETGRVAVVEEGCAADCEEYVGKSARDMKVILKVFECGGEASALADQATIPILIGL